MRVVMAKNKLNLLLKLNEFRNLIVIVLKKRVLNLNWHKEILLRRFSSRFLEVGA